MAIVWYVLFASLYLLKSLEAQTVSLSVTPPSPVVGEEVTFTCTASQDFNATTSVFYRRNIVLVGQFNVNSTSCTSVIQTGGQNYTLTCGSLPTRQLSLTIPAAYVTEDEHGTDWRCDIFLGTPSNTVQLTLGVPVSMVTITTDGVYRPSVTISAGNTRTFTCTTTASRPVARLSWFRGDNNITDQAGTATDQGTGDDKYTRQQSLTITGRVNDVDSGLKCEAVNIEGRTPVSSQTSNIIVQWEPETDPILTRDPPTTTLTEGVSVALTCQQTGGKPLATLTWSGVCTGKTPTESNDTTTVTSRVQLSVNRTYNGQTCTCESRHPANSYLKSPSETFLVLFGPDTVTVTGNQQIVADGVRHLTLTCLTAPYHQYVTLTWKRGNTLLTRASSPSNTSTAVGTVTSQVLTLTPDRTWDGDTISCTAETIGTAIQSTDSVQLDLLYQPYITVSSVPPSPIIERRELALTCDVDSNPISTVVWSRPGGQSISGTSQSDGIHVIPSVSRHDNGIYRCTASTSLQTNTLDMLITVYYSADNISVTHSNLTDNDTSRQLLCIPDGNPRLFKFSKWQHQSIYGQLIRELDGVTSGQESVLTIPDPGLDTRYQDTGYYVCRVENGVPDRNNQSVFSRSVYVSVKSPPVFVTDESLFTGQQEHTAVITVPFYTPTGYQKVELTKGNINMENRFILSTIHTNVSVPFVGRKFAVRGFLTVISVQKLKKSDFGRYVLTVTNDVGSQQFEFDLKETAESAAAKDSSIHDTGVAMLSTGVVLLLISIGIIGCIIIRKGRLSITNKTTTSKPEATMQFAEITTSRRGNGEEERSTYEEISKTDISELALASPAYDASEYENTRDTGVHSQGNSAYESLQGRQKPNVYEELASPRNDDTGDNEYSNTDTREETSVSILFVLLDRCRLSYLIDELLQLMGFQ